MARSTTCPTTWSPSPPNTLPAVPPTLCTVEVLGAAWAPLSLWLRRKQRTDQHPIDHRHNLRRNPVGNLHHV